MIVIERTTHPTADIAMLIGELEAILSAEYPPEQRHGLPLDEIFRPHICFFLARFAGSAAGCGGVALYPEFAEVKRLYVRKPMRGRGIAQALLDRIEAEARAAGRPILRLETGTAQRAAIRFYEKSGFRRRSAFPPYAGMPPAAIAGSIFLEKDLVTPVRGA